MRINFVAYLDPFRYNGGGERTSRFVIEEGRRRGHRIQVFARRTGKWSKLFPLSITNLPEADIDILSDVLNCPEDGRIDPGFLDGVIENRRYIHWNHSYVDMCPRPALPCGGDPSRCADCAIGFSRRLHARAIANIFGSPLHYRTARALLGADALRDVILWRPMIDTQLFYNQHIERDIEFLYVGTIAEYKGYYNLKRQFAGKDILLIGENLTGQSLIGRHIGVICHRDLPRYYNRARSFVHLPEWPEPQGRAIVEAALCGCELITNPNVGATSFDFDISNPRIIEDAPSHFWREVEERCG